jgi:hypothetical protein
MALDLFKSLFGNSKRRKKKNYDSSNPLSSTKFLKGMENTSVQPADPPEVIGRGKTATRRILNAPKPIGGLQRPKTQMKRFMARTKEGKRTGFAEKEGRGIWMDMNADIKKGSSEDKDQKLVFRNRLQSIRNKRKASAQARYDKQMAARNKRSSLFKTRTPEERQAAYDTAFSRPLGQNTMLGRASANREQRQIDMQKLNVQRKKEREAKKANRENS